MILSTLRACTSAFTPRVRLLFRPLSRSSQGRTITNGRNVTKTIPKTAAETSTIGPPLLRHFVKHVIFTGTFCYVIYGVNIMNEVLESKYKDMQTRFPGDVYSEIWGEILVNYMGVRDTLLHRRVLQLAAFMSALLVVSPLIIRSARARNWFALHHASSSISPITSMFLHGNTFHLLGNMLGLYVLTIGWGGNGPLARGSLDNISHQHLLAFLVLAGGATSVACSLRSFVMVRFFSAPTIPGIGFSGALSGLLMYECMLSPKSQMAFIFMSDRTFTAEQFRTIFIGMELFIFAFARYHRIDNIAHLFGAAFGYLYSKFAGLEMWNSELVEWHKQMKDEFK